MGNLTALMAHTQPGEEVILEANAHIYYYEAGGLARIAGLMPWLIETPDGCITPRPAAASRAPSRHSLSARHLVLSGKVPHNQVRDGFNLP